MKLSHKELKELMDEKYDQYNRPGFIDKDPISIPHQFSKKEDIEISGFLTATIAWGQRISIIKNANKMMKLMDNSPFDFIMNAKEKNIKQFEKFVHRTFNGTDATFFIKSIKNIYVNHKGLENVFCTVYSGAKNLETVSASISGFRELFFSIPHPARTEKHVSNPAVNSSAKRLCMYLRWMVRTDKRGVDFGIWKNKNLLPAHLMCPLDVHSGNVARKLGVLTRTQNDWKAVVELTTKLRLFDPTDPVKYDFALFGLGAFEKF